MLMVKTRLDRSPVHGIGLYADQFIPRGTVIWKYHPAVDVKLTDAQVESLSEPCQTQIRRYSYREKVSRLYLLCGDDARFYNHSAHPNCVDTDDTPEGLTVAARDIQPGEEMTCDYRLFDLDLIEGKYRI